jgi:hypothetical protein
MRWSPIALLFFALACTTTSTFTSTGTGIFAPHDDAGDEEEAPRGLSLSIQSIAPDGTVVLDLRNYSLETFVFSGTPDRPRLVLEIQSGSSHSWTTLSPGMRSTHEVPAGERLQLKTKIGGVTGRVRIGIKSKEFRYTVWTSWIAR